MQKRFSPFISGSVPPICYAVVSSLAILSAGCFHAVEDVDESVPDNGACIQGESRSCSCDSGEDGVQVCDQGEFRPCECPQDSPQRTGTSGVSAADDFSTAGASGSGSIVGSGGASGFVDASAVTDGNPVMDGSTGPTAEPDSGIGEPGDIIIDPADEAQYIFDDSQLRTYELRLSETDLAFLNQSPGSEQYVEGSLLFEGQTHEPVGIRYKGSWGAFAECAEYLPGQFPAEVPLGRKTCTKISIKVALNRPKDSGVLFYGLKKLQFHAMNADDSLMRERLGYALFNEMNVPAPRAVHARLIVNGRLEGLFVLVEQIDGRFTRSRFTEGGKGNLYKEIWPIHSDPSAYINALESNTDENPTADRILAFKAAIESGQGVGAIDGWMDLDHQMRYIAVDRTIVNDDGIFHWWCNVTGMGRNPSIFGDPNAHGNHNYYWYEETNADRLWLIPWDLDFAFLGETELTPIETPWYETNVVCVCGGDLVVKQVPPGCDPLTQHWAALYDQYLDEVRKFLDGPFNQQNVTVKLDRWAAQIDNAVREQAATTHNGPHLSYAEWRSQLSQFRDSILPILRSEAQQRLR